MAKTKQSQKKIPKAKGIDNTIQLLKVGYPFIPDIMKKLNTQIFQTRLMGKKAICITGKEAARLFYNPNYFIRQGANPMRVQKTLFGVNAIQGMDGTAHDMRKQLFLEIMAPERTDELKKLFLTKCEQAIPRWQQKKQICLFHESASLLCESACEWCGVPITHKDARIRAHQFIQMIYAIGRVGPQYWKGKSSRKSTEKWIQTVISDVRDGKTVPKEGSALARITSYSDSDGNLLTDEAAAIELINVIRPIVAVSIYIVYAALALHDYPQYEDRLKQQYQSYYHMFAQEVRRFYPVGPFLGARVKKDFIWNEYQFKKGTLVFLDVYGMNSDPSIWKYPNVFCPDNFLNRKEDDYELLSQGGGDYKTGHRCPGEVLTIELIKQAVDLLVNRMEYTVPPQDLEYTLKKIPTLPASGFVMSHIKKYNNAIN